MRNGKYLTEKMSETRRNALAGSVLVSYLQECMPDEAAAEAESLADALAIPTKAIDTCEDEKDGITARESEGHPTLDGHEDLGAGLALELETFLKKLQSLPQENTRENSRAHIASSLEHLKSSWGVATASITLVMFASNTVVTSLLVTAVSLATCIFYYTYYRHCRHACGVSKNLGGQDARLARTFWDAFSDLEKSIRRGFRLIKHAELRARGFTLTEKLPPIARIEMNSLQGNLPMQCVPLRKTLLATLVGVNEMILSVSPKVLHWNVRPAKLAPVANGGNGLFIQSLHDCIKCFKSQRLWMARALHLSLQQSYAHSPRHSSRHSRTSTKKQAVSLNFIQLCHEVYLKDITALRDELQYALNGEKQKREAEESRAQTRTLRKTQEKMKMKMRRATSSLDQCVAMLRAEFDALSVDIFSWRDEVHNTVEEAFLDKTKPHDPSAESAVLKAGVGWEALHDRLQRLRNVWLTQSENLGKQWDTLEVCLNSTAAKCGHHETRKSSEKSPSSNIADSVAETRPRENHNEMHDDNGAKVTTPEENKNCVDIFEISHRYMKRGHRQARAVPAVVESGQSRADLSELGKVLARRDRLPERIRKDDRSGWLEGKAPRSDEDCTPHDEPSGSAPRSDIPAQERLCMTESLFSELQAAITSEILPHSETFESDVLLT